MKNKVMLILGVSILLVCNISLSEELYIETRYKRITQEMEIQNQESIKHETEGKFAISDSSKNLYVYQNLANAFIGEINKNNPLTEKELEQFFNEKYAPFLDLHKLREEGTSITLALESFYNQKELDEESFYNKKIKQTSLIRVFPSFQQWRKMLSAYQSPNGKKQMNVVKELQSPEQYYKEYGQYYAEGASIEKLQKRMLEQNNINLDDLRNNFQSKNLSLREFRIIDDVGALITDVALIRRIRADLQGNNPDRLENFQKWLYEREKNNSNRLSKVGIDVKNLDLSPIYP